jgi:plasmid replication initiation protein
LEHFKTLKCICNLKILEKNKNMNEYEKKEITKKREYWVVKGNELIQKSRFELSLTEQKTIAFICSMIKKANSIPYQLDYEFNIRDYCKVCGIDYDNGKNYVTIKATLKSLRDRSMWLTLENGSETLVGWLSKVTTNKQSGIVHIRLDEDLAPYLFDLGQKFTQYQLYNILAMKSAFSVRMYELLKSYAYQKNKTFDLDELKRLLEVENVKSYVRFPDFRRKVLEKAQEEINELTDLNISYEPITKGRKVIKIKFRIELKSPIDRAIAGATTNDRLDYTAKN